MSYIIDIEVALEEPEPLLPKIETITNWLKVAISKFKPNAEVSVRIVDNQEMKALNHRYRHKNKPTNVLSFPTELPEGIELDHELLGDIVIASDVVKEECIQQHKSFDAHFAHMIVHGALHLLGFDHENDADAKIMENHEIKILKELNFANPYQY